MYYKQSEYSFYFNYLFQIVYIWAELVAHPLGPYLPKTELT